MPAGFAKDEYTIFILLEMPKNRWMWKEWLKSMKKPVIPMSPAQTEMSGR